MGRISVTRVRRTDAELEGYAIRSGAHDDRGITDFAAVSLGDTLLDALLDGGIDIETECGGNCACTTCLIQVLFGDENLSPMEEPERDRIATAELPVCGARLACQAIVTREAAEIGIRLVTLERE